MISALIKELWELLGEGGEQNTYSKKTTHEKGGAHSHQNCSSWGKATLLWEEKGTTKS
jgi:hypothetical protein